MSILEHDFTEQIVNILDRHYENNGEYLLNNSEILQYLNIKTKAANRGSTSRSSFANHYAIYVLIEDYLNGKFDKTGNYQDYSGAKYSDLLHRWQKLPFGRKLQNHAINHRLNQEFKKCFPKCEHIPIIRDADTNRYWINENLIVIMKEDNSFNLGIAIKEIIEAYIQARQRDFSDFMNNCQKLINLQEESSEVAIQFITDLFSPNVDARIFEIVSFAVLKQHYANQHIYWGWSSEELFEESLVLYKTGRTNANDGGIDFVMKPLGRFFQVTEFVDAGKYFLDIDKVQRYPMTFVVKTNDSSSDILQKIEKQAKSKYSIRIIVAKYIDSIEEIINIPKLLDIYKNVIEAGRGLKVIEEIILQSRVEFNMEEE